MTVNKTDRTFPIDMRFTVLTAALPVFALSDIAAPIAQEVDGLCLYLTQESCTYTFNDCKLRGNDEDHCLCEVEESRPELS